MKHTIKLLVVLSSFFSIFSGLHAQLSAPKAEAIYGGRVVGITAIGLSGDSSRIFVTTESANSAFYADVKHSSGTPSSFSPFQVIPSMNASAGLGGNIRDIAGHGTSGNMFFIHQGNLYGTHPDSSSYYTIEGIGGVNSLFIDHDHLFYVKGAELHYGKLNAIGFYTADASSPIILPAGIMETVLSVHPQSKCLYVFGKGNNPSLYKSLVPFDSLALNKTLKDISPAVLSGVTDWSAFAIAPDGRMFAAGSNFMQKKIGLASNDSTWRSYSSGFGGAPGTNISFGGDSSFYKVYYANMVNDSMGVDSLWHTFGIFGKETNPNDGPVWGDPVNMDVVYMSTDMGIGCSENRGDRIFEINEGITAVQVNDFDMLVNKTTAWAASKSGIRKVSTYTSSPSWTKPFFPMGDGSPFYAVGMAGQDTNTVYACNLRVYKSTNGGMNWNRLFSAEDPPYNFPAFGNNMTGAAQIRSVEVCPFDTNIVMVGYTIERGNNGGLFYSYDGGANWDQILITASSVGNDVNVEDIIFAMDGTDTVAFVGVSHNSTYPSGQSVYKLTKSGSNWIVKQDMDASGTSSGTPIMASITDIAKSPTGDTLVVCGTDMSTNQPVSYFKALNSSRLWESFPSAGFPSTGGQQTKAITYGIDTIYVAVDEDIYLIPVGGSSWTLGYSYPRGTSIQFLYFDELLVGTESGIFGHQGTNTPATLIDFYNWNEDWSLVQVYPNPVTKFPLSIQLTQASSSPVQVNIYDALGRLTYRKLFHAGEFFQLGEEAFEGTGHFYIEVNAEDLHYTGRLLVR
ncbi:MAG: T9SS type A sorting domain-containing protein [Bacteroidota bacterium]